MTAIVVIGVVDVGKMARNGSMMILGSIAVMEGMRMQIFFIKFLSLGKIMHAYNSFQIIRWILFA